MLLIHLFLVGDCKGELDIIPTIALIANKVYLQPFPYNLSFLIPFSVFHNANIYIKTTNKQFVVNDVLHDVVFFLLSEVQLCITQPYICKIILKG